MIATGSESVVKADIDASNTVFAGGDVVGHKQVYSTRHETHIHEPESAAGTMLQGLWALFNPCQSGKTSGQELWNTPGGILALVILVVITMVATAVMVTAIAISDSVKHAPSQVRPALPATEISAPDRR